MQIASPPSTNGSAYKPAVSGRGLTVADVAALYRVSPAKVRHWISTGELAAVNTAARLSGRPRWVIREEALVAFEKRRAGGQPTRQPRRRRQCTEKDWYP